MVDALTSLTIAEAAELIRGKQLSPVELTQAHLDRIEKIDPLLNSYITVTSEKAIKDAEGSEYEIDMRRGKDRYIDPMMGIPIALKDLYETQEIRTTAGSRFLSDNIPKFDAAVVWKLPYSVLLGKTNMHEWALGVINDNPHYGVCNNPWDVTRSPGGSSGGSAAALAAGLCMGAMGSDTRGSIRIPAALCGIVGLKPTYGRVSLSGVIPLSWSLDHAGPMARTVKDVGILLQEIASDTESDPSGRIAPMQNYLSLIEGGIQKWRVGVPDDTFLADVDSEILVAFQQAVETLQKLGATIAETDLNFLRDSREASRVIVSADAAAYHQERLESNPENFGGDVLKRLREGQAYTGVEYAHARHLQTELQGRLAYLLSLSNLKGFNILAMPTTPMVAPRLDDPAELDRARMSLSWFTAPFNMAGLPAISLPCGFTSDGLPIGLQLVARPWAEATLLRAAYAYEQATEWHKRRPPLD